MSEWLRPRGDKAERQHLLRLRANDRQKNHPLVHTGVLGRCLAGSSSPRSSRSGSPVQPAFCLGILQSHPLSCLVSAPLQPRCLGRDPVLHSAQQAATRNPRLTQSRSAPISRSRDASRLVRRNQGCPVRPRDHKRLRFSVFAFNKLPIVLPCLEMEDQLGISCKLNKCNNLRLFLAQKI
jgi:hypothetical protein